VRSLEKRPYFFRYSRIKPKIIRVSQNTQYIIRGRFWKITMKSKTQKAKELEKGKELLERSRALLFFDYASVSTKDFTQLKRAVSALGGRVMVVKKRLLSILLKERGISWDSGAYKVPAATVFAPDVEKTSATLLKFLSGLNPEYPKQKILGGYNLVTNEAIVGEMIRFIGELPPREVLITQLAGIIAAPIRSLLYLLQERSKKQM